MSTLEAAIGATGAQAKEEIDLNGVPGPCPSCGSRSASAGAACAAEDLEILLNVRSYFGSNSLHWHKSAVLSSQIGVGAAAAVAAAAVTVSDHAVNLVAFVLCFLIGLFSRSQAVHATKEFNTAVGVLIKVDHATRVFKKGDFGLPPDVHLYPDAYNAAVGHGPKEDQFLARNAWLAFIGPFLIGVLPLLLSASKLWLVMISSN
ncbi:MAG: hypothetical protein K0M70_02645 [Arenimonas sp.]|uniref:hypothetical protein n=1 Tax=Arenimonas sp. TaxID=1872635 RepID=UPI0025BFFB85|nr:hypothetical protein [Arenimonas sp.]MBW8366739.1 hypothetical protein [Arenimonas sp.]